MMATQTLFFFGSCLFLAWSSISLLLISGMKDMVYLNTFISIDAISLALILLVVWLSFSSSMYLMEFGAEFFKVKLNMFIIFLTSSIMACFLLNNLLLFFIFYELSLIPIFFMVWGWGMGVKKMKAGVFLLLYTSILSTPLLLSLLYCMSCLSMFNWPLMNMTCFVTLGPISLFTLTMSLAFFVKMPIYSLHMWLPKAHVEASTIGSMILAGALLKMGVYGLIRIKPFLMNIFYSSYTLLVIMAISLGGMIIASLIMLMMTDGKIIIAYSSVAHMNMLIASMLILSLNSYNTSFLISLSHGFISPALFLLFYYLYSSNKSRSVLMARAPLVSSSVTLSLILFYTFMANTGCPPSYNFLGEFIVFLNMINFSFMPLSITMLVMSILILSASSYMYSRISSGMVKLQKKSTLKVSANISIFMLLSPSLLMWGFPL